MKYYLKLNDIPVNVQRITKRKDDSLNFAQLWHARLGHISSKRMIKMVNEVMFESSDVNSSPDL